jgi:hypothetical protein
VGHASLQGRSGCCDLDQRDVNQAPLSNRNVIPPPKLQVSRRLARRLHADLRRGKLGYARLTVQAFHFLLTQLPDKANLLAPELVLRTPVSTPNPGPMAHHQRN